MALTQTQEGIVGQSEVAKLFIVGSDGEVEAAIPMTDDDNRDIETHRRRKFEPPVAVQVKTTWRLWRHRNSEIIQIPFSLPAKRLVNDPRFWYFFGYFDRARIAFRDPVFLACSKDVYRHAMPRLVGDRWRFTFQASLKPGAHDRWSPCRVPTAEVGHRLLAILRQLDKKPTPAFEAPTLEAFGDFLWTRARPRTARRVAA